MDLREQPRGHLGVLADIDRQVLVGAWAVGPQASEWIHTAAPAVREEIPIARLLDSVAQFPTYNEGWLKAASAVAGWSSTHPFIRVRWVGRVCQGGLLTDVEQRLREAGLPADSLGSRRAALPEPVQELHRWALRTVADTGQPPADADLEERAHALGLDLHGALAALAAAELLFVDQVRGRVLGGVPFAAGPTAHRVSVADGPTVSANCAVDALGIGAMLGRDTDVRSADPLTGEPVTASQRGGKWTWEPPQAVVFVGSSGAGRITDACCPAINFFASDSNANEYRDRHGLTGKVLSMPDAAVAGALVFGGLLAGPLL